MRLRVTVTHVLMWLRTHTAWPVFTGFHILLYKNSGIVLIYADMFKNVDFMELFFRATVQITVVILYLLETNVLRTRGG